MLAHYGVARDGLPGEWPAGYDDSEPCTPAWQEPITGVTATWWRGWRVSSPVTPRSRTGGR